VDLETESRGTNRVHEWEFRLGGLPNYAGADFLGVNSKRVETGSVKIAGGAEREGVGRN